MASPFAADLLRGRVALVTGGATGIGREIASQFCRHGAVVGIMGRREAVVSGACGELNHEFPSHGFLDGPAFKGAGGGVSPGSTSESSSADDKSGDKKDVKWLRMRALAIPGDVRSQESADGAVRAMIAEFGRIDILVNCAAGNFLSTAEGLSLNAFRTVIDIDLNGSFNMCRAVFPELKKTRGNIINITAQLMKAQYPWQTHARAAKSGVDSLTESLAGEWSEYGIRVNGLAPGAIADTEALNRLVPPDMDRDIVGQNLPLGRMGTKEEMALICVFLASDATAGYVSGHTILADGGDAVKRPGGIPREVINALQEQRTKQTKAKL